ncbi:metallophosphoesterase [Ornithinibacillus halotolerans]|uniref:Serine/threonine protein phosphatase n=1 Tax=Ornithinibacillus halotolerans TaxID=1274357 RepID=A0A916S420_9BACI|nr:metallophosphoesterase [Ornithinibacillus halotolerans]GGA83455.1 serine/threonine protein phosphatase [Ornithinibacillus halotolerans]
MLNVQQIKLNNANRVIITSDIHANLSLFKKLLTKVNYSKDDYLIINGDLCEKGPNSLAVIDYVQSLVKDTPNVYVIKGNCDVVHRYVFNGNEGIFQYMRNRKMSVLNEMIDSIGYSLDDFSNLEELANFYRKHFANEINWLESLPTAIEIEDYIIVHAGIDSQDWLKTDEDTVLYEKAFYNKGHQLDKTVIVGHWPVVNYRSEQVSSHNPLIDLDKRIISIDGGNLIKQDGQLNALIIEGGNLSYTYVDELVNEVMIVKEHIDTTKRVGTVTYPNYEMEITQKEQFFTQCINKKLGCIQWIKNEYLIEQGGHTFSKDDLSVTFLTVKNGEYVKIIDDDCEGYALVKKTSGEVGWIPKECIKRT